MREMVKHKPDGTLAIGDDSYRVRERGADHYDVTRERDGVCLGEFVWHDPVEVLAEAAYRDVVRAIALAWSEPRSPIPIQ
jgi:hypothetical protein